MPYFINIQHLMQKIYFCNSTKFRETALEKIILKFRKAIVERCM